jgi:hypothetical protein
MHKSIALVSGVFVAAFVMTVGVGARVGQAPRCRTYPVTQQRTFSAGGSASETCDFNSATFVHTCTMESRAAGGAPDCVGSPIRIRG